MNNEEYTKHLEEINTNLIDANKRNTKEFQKTFRLMLIAGIILLIILCVITITLMRSAPANNINRNINYNHNIGGSEDG